MRIQRVYKNQGNPSERSSPCIQYRCENNANLGEKIVVTLLKCKCSMAGIQRTAHPVLHAQGVLNLRFLKSPMSHGKLLLKLKGLSKADCGMSLETAVRRKKI